MKTETFCWALTPQGAVQARRIAAGLGGRVCLPQRLAAEGEQGFDRLAEAVTECWQAERHVFVAAAGLVVRCIAPLLTRKDRDPAVVVCDQNGRFAVSLLSGHLGRSNELAAVVASILGAQAVITTGTDTAGLPAFDLLTDQADCAFADLAEVRAVSAALLEGRSVAVRDPLGILDAEIINRCPQCLILRDDADTDCGVGVVVSLAPLVPRTGLLRLHPRRVHVGVGCRRGVPGESIERSIRQALELADISPLCVASLASADLKSGEPGLREAAAAFGVEVRCFSAEAIAACPVPHPSAKAAEVLGVERAGVCEAAALLAAGPGACLLQGKQVFTAAGHLAEENAHSGMVTIALAYENRSF